MRRGFTLIELMIVVAIIGLLAAIAIPNFLLFACRSKQTEAKTVLRGIYTAEEAYRAEHDLYLDAAPADISIIGLAITGPVARRRYEYSVTNALPNSFSSHAVGQPGQMDNDLWDGDEKAGTDNTLNGCRP